MAWSDRAYSIIVAVGRMGKLLFEAGEIYIVISAFYFAYTVTNDIFVHSFYYALIFAGPVTVMFRFSTIVFELWYANFPNVDNRGRGLIISMTVIVCITGLFNQVIIGNSDRIVSASVKALAGDK